jgi:hypothetical protein
MDEATSTLVRSGLRSTAVKEDDCVDDFILMDAHGRPVQLQQLLETGPIAVAFYRGDGRTHTRPRGTADSMRRAESKDNQPIKC